MPLLGQQYDLWIRSYQQKDKKDSIDKILSGLPQNHRHNLHYLLKFLQLVASQSSVNKMTAANLSIVLAPNLLWDTNDASDRDLADSNVINDIVEMLIGHVDFFFRGFGPGNIDYFKEVTLEKPRHLIKVKSSSEDSLDSTTTTRTPVPKPRSSRALPKGPPPPLAPRPPMPADRQIQPNSTTHL